MRILSQRGHMDLPYEHVGVCISAINNNEIIAYSLPSDSDDVYFTIAVYSNEKKAQKAMEMLREAYTGTFYVQNVKFPEGSMDDLKECVKHGFGCITVLKDSQDLKFEPLNICFQFPADEEIEV